MRLPTHQTRHGLGYPYLRVGGENVNQGTTRMILQKTHAVCSPPFLEAIVLAGIATNDVGKLVELGWVKLSGQRRQNPGGGKA